MKRVDVAFSLNPEQLKARAQLLKGLEGDERVQDFLKTHRLPRVFLEQHVQKFADWCANLDRCEQCPGLHACTQPTPGYVMELVMNPNLSWELMPCRYQREALARLAHRRYFVQLDAPEALLQADMAHVLDAPADAAYKQAIKNLPAWFEHPNRGFFFHGPLGSGKSHLAMAILNHFAKQQKRVAFVSVPELARIHFSSYQSDESAEARLNQLARCELLVLDDVGAETYSAYFRDDVLFNLLNQRMNEHRLTLFTSNHTFESLLNHYRHSPKGDDEPIKAARVLERIQTLSQALLINGRNRRG